MFEVFESIKILSLASKKEGNLISLENASALLLDQKKRKTVCLPPGVKWHHGYYHCSGLTPEYLQGQLKI